MRPRDAIKIQFAGESNYPLYALDYDVVSGLKTERTVAGPTVVLGEEGHGRTIQRVPVVGLGENPSRVAVGRSEGKRAYWGEPEVPEVAPAADAAESVPAVEAGEPVADADLAAFVARFNTRG